MTGRCCPQGPGPPGMSAQREPPVTCSSNASMMRTTSVLCPAGRSDHRRLSRRRPAVAAALTSVQP